ncbi:SUMF1/EgtB/PvdO family nonheme iron enzyme [Streptomyces sp. V1I1]|uniref:SUMF1/EgtB/PvdO family nonheme iron enzyme n=1 Tax=Streptomyces sp. V1I1 TaxID=3042272 RepID=UPI002789FBDA|nr:SUMF1/EgtB/PvdO family nonheme iron enzyme [Streptomyces sp. V1I1]MDQ0939145.1 formylglycine-generating enzyme required for sulfatase activity/energy-coupling factor transporter ATP-binding protein EcfA2 [Streptomyces sp. V1I1]
MSRRSSMDDAYDTGTGRAVEVLYDRGPDTPPSLPRWSAGSGYLIGGHLVLTAAHNLDYRQELSCDEQLLVRDIDGVEYMATALLVCDRSSDEDLALLVIDDPEVPDTPAVSFAQVNRDSPEAVTGCWAVGFPRFGQAGQVLPEGSSRDTWHVHGEISPGGKQRAGRLALRVNDAPRPLGDSAWEGMSGAVVFTGSPGGPQHAVGVVIEHHTPEGESALTVAPVNAIIDPDRARQWWEYLGVGEPDGLPVLPRPPRGSGPRPRPGWERGYLKLLRDKHAGVTVPLSSEDQSVALERVYLPLDLSPGDGHGTVTAEDLLQAKVALVIGDAGSGKSTFLRWLTMCLVKKRLEQQRTAGTAPAVSGPRARLPVWMPAVDALESLSGSGSGRAVSPRNIGDSWTKALARVLNLQPEQTRRLLDDGDLIVVFDGLDEIPDADARVGLVEAIQVLHRMLSPSAVHVVISSRPQAWADALPNATRVRLLPMTEDKRDQYLQKWCAGVRTSDPERARRFIDDAIRDSSGLAKLATNPQFAVMLVQIASGPIPHQRVPLYEAFIENVLAKPAVRKLGISPTMLRGHLEAMAVALQRERSRPTSSTGYLHIDAAHRILAERFAAAEPAGSVRSLLDSLVLHTGLLAIKKPSPFDCTVAFVHQTFQEFLAAGYFATRPHELAEHLADAAWVETIALAAGIRARSDPDRLPAFFTALLRPPRIPPGSDAASRDTWIAWAPRLAAVTVALDEVDSFLPEERKADLLAPVHAVQRDIKTVLASLPLPDRRRIAAGFCRVLDSDFEVPERWAEIPAGAFIRGSDDLEAWDHERPAKTIRLDRYLIQRWPVTVGEYARFLADGGQRDSRWWDGEGCAWRDREDAVAPLGWEAQRVHTNRPVTGVSFWEATAYARWLSRCGPVPEGHVAALPTEAQWEKAARGPTVQTEPRAKRFPWGDDWLDDRANCRRSNVGICPVMLFPTGPYRIWDMAGNVAERCRDGFVGHSEAETTDVNPVVAEYTHGHVVKGGGFRSFPMDLRVSARFGEDRDARADWIGFRLAAVPPGPEG